MGWSSLYKPKHETTREWVKSNYSSEDYEVIDVAAKLTEVYAAVKNKKTQEVFALILLVHHSRGYHNFSYKSMDEFCGPGATNCPKRILELLTPLTKENDPNGWAEKWRNDCWNKLFNSANAKGKDYFILPKKIGFTNGYEFNCFRKVKSYRGMYVGVWLDENGELQESGGYYKFNIKHFDYSPCTKEMVIKGLENIKKKEEENCNVEVN